MPERGCWSARPRPWRFDVLPHLWWTAMAGKVVQGQMVPGAKAGCRAQSMTLGPIKLPEAIHHELGLPYSCRWTCMSSRHTRMLTQVCWPRLQARSGLSAGLDCRHGQACLQLPCCTKAVLALDC